MQQARISEYDLLRCVAQIIGHPCEKLVLINHVCTLHAGDVVHIYKLPFHRLHQCLVMRVADLDTIQQQGVVRESNALVYYAIDQNNILSCALFDNMRNPRGVAGSYINVENERDWRIVTPDFLDTIAEHVQNWA